jgi:hypothetical protein
MISMPESFLDILNEERFIEVEGQIVCEFGELLEETDEETGETGEETDEETYEELSVDERDIVEETIFVPRHYANEYKNFKYEVYKNENISNIITDEFWAKINNHHDFISISDDSFFSNTIDEFLNSDNYLIDIERFYHTCINF